MHGDATRDGEPAVTCSMRHEAATAATTVENVVARALQSRALVAILLLGIGPVLGLITPGCGLPS